MMKNIITDKLVTPKKTWDWVNKYQEYISTQDFKTAYKSFFKDMKTFVEKFRLNSLLSFPNHTSKDDFLTQAARENQVFVSIGNNKCRFSTGFGTLKVIIYANDKCAFYQDLLKHSAFIYRPFPMQTIIDMENAIKRNKPKQAEQLLHAELISQKNALKRYQELNETSFFNFFGQKKLTQDPFKLLGLPQLSHPSPKEIEEAYEQRLHIFRLDLDSKFAAQAQKIINAIHLAYKNLNEPPKTLKK